MLGLHVNTIGHAPLPKEHIRRRRHLSNNASSKSTPGGAPSVGSGVGGGAASETRTCVDTRLRMCTCTQARIGWGARVFLFAPAQLPRGSHVRKCEEEGDACVRNVHAHAHDKLRWQRKRPSQSMRCTDHGMPSMWFVAEQHMMQPNIMQPHMSMRLSRKTPWCAEPVGMRPNLSRPIQCHHELSNDRNHNMALETPTLWDCGSIWASGSLSVYRHSSPILGAGDLPMLCRCLTPAVRNNVVAGTNASPNARVPSHNDHQCLTSCERIRMTRLRDKRCAWSTAKAASEDSCARRAPIRRKPHPMQFMCCSVMCPTWTCTHGLNWATSLTFTARVASTEV